MRGPEDILLFFFSYLFNLSSFFIYSNYVASNISKYRYIRKALDIYFYILLAGLPIMAVFYMKFDVVVWLYNSKNTILLTICLILVTLSLYIYWVLINTYINHIKLWYLNKINNKSFIVDRSTLNICIFFVAVNVIYNIFFIYVLFM